MPTMDEYLTRPVGGRKAMGERVASLAGHDDNHLAQLRRPLDGRP